MDDKQRQKLRKILKLSAYSLLGIWLIVFIYGIFIVRGDNIDYAKLKLQIVEFSIHDSSYASKTKDEVHKGPDVKESLLPRVAIIITNLGANKYLTEQAMNLPNKVALGFVPYVNNMRQSVYDAMNKGFEVFMYLPFQQKDYPNSSPGAYPILATNTPETNIEIINALLADFMGIKGVYVKPDEAITDSQDIASQLISHIRDAGLLFATGKKFPPTYLMSRDFFRLSDIIIDDSEDPDAIKDNLQKLVNLAKKYKSAVGYMETYPSSIALLSEWIDSLNQQGVELVYLSKIIPH